MVEHHTVGTKRAKVQSLAVFYQEEIKTGAYRQTEASVPVVLLRSFSDAAPRLNHALSKEFHGNVPFAGNVYYLPVPSGTFA